VTLPREALIDLMALADGELHGAAEQRALRQVASDPQARQFVDATRGPIGPWLAAEFGDRATSGGADGIADAVMMQIEATMKDAPPVRRPGMAPIEATIKDAPPKQWPSMRLTRANAIGTAVAALACAAAISLLVHAGRGHEDKTASGAPNLVLAQPGASPSGAAGGDGVEVDEIDSPAHDIAVFEISGGPSSASARIGRSPSVVIWVEDSTGAP